MIAHTFTIFGQCQTTICDKLRKFYSHPWLLIILGSTLGLSPLQAQPSNLPDSLGIYAKRMMMDSTEFVRMTSNYRFIPNLVQFLKGKGSFYHPLDSLKSYISILYPADSSFRILSWQIALDAGFQRYFGAIQMRSDTLVLFPLFDRGDTLRMDLDPILSHDHWYGCLYYNLIARKVKKNTYYTLFGYRQQDLMVQVKVMELLHFQNGKPVFGAPLIQMQQEDSTWLQNRYLMKYSTQAIASLNYNEDFKRILFDHLAPMNAKYKGVAHTLVPDGTYEAFEWKKGKWKHIEQAFKESINHPDNPPRPVPLSQDRMKNLK